jgi:ABC-2 type transport system permease protein
VLTLRLQWAFLLREARVEGAHAGALATRLIAAIGSVLVFFFIARALRGAATAGLGPYDASYFAFAVVGLALLGYMGHGVGAMASGLRDSQASGTLELLVLSPARTWVLLLCSSLAAYPLAAVSFAAYLGTGVALGLDLGAANVAAAALTVALATVGFAALGVLVASVVFVTARGNPAAWAVRTGSIVLGGVFYPVGVLPEAMQVAGQALPLTHALDALRGSLLLGQGVGELWPSLLALAGTAAVLLPLSLAACTATLRIARTDGSLRP